jgi:lipopolysaccharide/colanic/teichoic acid biosynthesis glycosyltransferase
VRVLLVTQFFDPEPTFKGMMLARELRRRGHEVEVLTGFPNYPEGRIHAGWRQRPLDRREVDGVTVTRVPLWPSHDRSGIRRAASYASFAASASVAALFVRRPDVVHLYHPPATTGLVALVLKHVRGVPFVLDVQDLWPDSLLSTGMVTGRAPLAAAAALVGRVTAAAEHVVTLSPGMTRLVAERSRRPEAVTTVLNWSYEDDIEQGPTPAARPGPAVEPVFVATFAGNLGPAQGLDTLLDAAALLRDRPDVRLRVVGEGIDSARLRRRARDEHLTSVEFVGRVPVAEVGGQLASADALIVHLRDEPLFRVTIPSKTQAYLLAGRPVVMAVRGDAADLVEAAGAGVVVPPGDPAALAAALRRLADLAPSARDAMGRAGRRWYDDELSLRRGVDSLEQVLEAASDARPRVAAVKRVADVVGAAALLVAAAPLVAAVAVLVALGLGRPVLFRQERPGRDGRPVTLVKFRTMTDRRGDDGALLPDAARLTRLGALLRVTSLDELPSLVAVLRGDLSLVGPRPLHPRYTAWFTAEERRRLRCRPGLSGLAQVNGRNAASWDDRLALDVRYARKPSLRTEARIVARTVAAVLRRAGAVAEPSSLMPDLDVERRAAAEARAAGSRAAGRRAEESRA